MVDIYYFQIDDWITNITTVYSKMAKVVEVGKSYEGRTIRLIEVILNELFFRVFQKSDFDSEEFRIPSRIEISQ
jgi:hypothetical protein